MTINKNESLSEHDGLRSPEYICVPDPRTRHFVKVNQTTGATRPLSQFDQHEAVATYTLTDTVPEDVRILFDTARNLYLYAWFVYRFYNVAEQQVFACLEMALREYLKDEMPLPVEYWPERKRDQAPSMQPMLRYVIDKGYIHNEGFRTWRDRGITRARHRYEQQKVEELREKGLDSIDVDYSKAVVIDEDMVDYDYLEVLLRYIPDTRNDYAHGSKRLHKDVLHSFEVVSEIINQLYPVE